MNRAPTKEVSANQKRGLVHVVMHGEDVVEAVLVGIDVDHPAENDRVEAASRVGAGLLRGDGAVQAELRPVGAAELIARRHAEICVQVPHGDAKRDAGVQLVFGGALGHGVHRADKLITGGGFFVEQGSRARGIERERLQESIAIAGEVIFGLQDIRQKDFEAVVERGVVVLVFFDAGAELSDDFVGALEIFGHLRSHRSHEHVLAVRVAMPGRHVLDSCLFAGLFLAHIHSGHGFGWSGWRLRRGGFLRGGALPALVIDGRRMVAGHGHQQDRDYKDGAKNHESFRGEMNQRSTG